MSTDIVLTGYEPLGTENLSIRILARSLICRGFRAAVVPVRSIGAAHDAIAEILRLKPRVLGLSLQDSVSSVHTLALAGLARRRGFSEFLVCGGPFATLQPNWIFNRSPAVDAVIRHDGEGPLAALVDAIARGESPTTVPGVMTRDGKCLSPVPSTPQSWRPLRGPRPEIMGVPTADLLTGRGCRHSCEYCTHAAVAKLGVQERRGPTASRAELHRNGLDRVFHRSIVDLAEEMANLYHDDGVRYFHFIDENPIPENERAALDWIGNLGDALTSLGVDKISLGMMTRGDALTPKVIDALSDLGLVHTLVGVESGTGRGLNPIGRSGNAARTRAALARLMKRDVIATFNCLLIHPECTPESIREELDFLGNAGDALFDTARVIPFSGTRFSQRMQNEGRLFGGDILPSFDLPSPVVDRFRIFNERLRTEALGTYNPIFRLNDLLLSLRLFARFGRDSLSADIERQARRVVREVNTCRVTSLRSLLDAAESGGSTDDIIRAAAIASGEHSALIDELSAQLVARAGKNSNLARRYRNIAAAASLIFTLSTAPGCYDSSGMDEDEEKEDSGIPRDSDTSTGADSDTDTDTDVDSDTDTDSDTDSDADIDADSDTDTDTENCDYYDDRDRLIELVENNCEWIEREYEFDFVAITIDEQGKATQIEILPYSTYSDSEEIPEWVDEMKECYVELLADEEFPCLDGQTIRIHEQLGGIMPI